MRKYFLTVIALVFMLAFIAPIQSNAAIADGTYSVNYQVNKPGSNSASMANDYFLKPAKLIVKNGKMTMQLTIKNSSWVTQFNPPGGAKVISSNEGSDQRVVQFSASNANLITIGMKIDIDDIDYHHAYSVDFVFDSSGLPEAKAEEPKQEPKEQPKQEQPQTKSAAPTEASKSSSGSNTSSNKPATTETKESTKESSKQVETTQSPDDDSTQSEEITADTEQADQSEVVENPETSDELPLLAVLLFIVAAIVFVRTKQTKMNG